MIEPQPPESQKPAVSPLNAILVIVALVPLIAGFIFLGTSAGIANFLFMGFTFILYWTGLKQMNPAEFRPALVGALSGLGLAYLIYLLPKSLGIPGVILAMAGVVLATYLLIRGQAAIVINYAFMLFLTIGTSFMFKANMDFAAAAASIILAALYVGGLVQIGKYMSSRKGQVARNASAG